MLHQEVGLWKLFCGWVYPKIYEPVDFIHKLLSCHILRVEGVVISKVDGPAADAYPVMDPLIQTWMNNRIRLITIIYIRVQAVFFLCRA